MIFEYIFLFTVGTGHNPNYGHAQPPNNDVQHGVGVANYNHQNANLNQQQQYQQYNLNNNYNPGQRPNMNAYYYYAYNRDPPLGQGWYAGSNNYWYNKGQSVKPHAWLFIISMGIFFICM